MFEDLELVSRIRSEGRFVFLNEAVQTSARRFHRHGAFRQQLYNTALWFGWLLGLSSHHLKRFYSDDPNKRGAVLGLGACLTKDDSTATADNRPISSPFSVT